MWPSCHTGRVRQSGASCILPHPLEQQRLWADRRAQRYPTHRTIRSSRRDQSPAFRRDSPDPGMPSGSQHGAPSGSGSARHSGRERIHPHQQSPGAGVTSVVVGLSTGRLTRPGGSSPATFLLDLLRSCVSPPGFGPRRFSHRTNFDIETVIAIGNPLALKAAPPSRWACSVPSIVRFSRRRVTLYVSGRPTQQSAAIAAARWSTASGQVVGINVAIAIGPKPSVMPSPLRLRPRILTR